MLSWLLSLTALTCFTPQASYLAFLIFTTAGANHGFITTLSAAGYGLSVATNVVATLLIGYIYW